MSIAEPEQVAAPLGWAAVSDTVQLDLEQHRRELTGYCYRMLGSGFEAEDAVQETMVRACRAADSFEGRSSLRSWLYRIATNVCLDLLQGRQRRAQPMDFGPSGSADAFTRAVRPDDAWLQPVPDASVMPTDGDPAELAATRESIRLAFVAALQHLPARQRAVLILREVLRWKAEEVAELLGSTVASVNSALQRARATLADGDITLDLTDPTPIDAAQEALLARYVDAFERYDISELVALIHEDAGFSMPPFDFWLEGTDEIAKWYLGEGAACAGSRLLPTWANGCPAFGAYKVDPAGGHSPFALQVLEITDGRITHLHHFLDPELFGTFGLPTHLP